MPLLSPRTLVSRRLVTLSLTGLTLALAPALPVLADTAVRAVTLSTAGLAMIEAQGPLGAEPLRLSVLRDDVDDILKSLWVLDPSGSVPMLTLAGPGSFEDGFAHLPFGPQDLADRARLLGTLAGAPVTLERRGETWSGTIMGVSQRPCENGPCATLTVQTDAGAMLEFDLDAALSVSLSDSADRDAVAAGLRAWRGGANPRRVELALSSDNPAPRDVGLIYLQEAPLWQTAWRAIDTGEGLTLTGWAVVENTTGLDWDGITLTLATGSVRAIDADLYTRRYAGRESAQLLPAPVMAPLSMARGAVMESMSDSMVAVEPGVVAVTADDGDSFSRFTLDTPVTLPAGQMISLPFLSQDLDQQVLRLYQGGSYAEHPSLALQIVNPLPLRLPAGVVTIYEDGRGHAGDATIPELAPGAEETVVYAQDTAVEVTEDTRQAETLREIRLANGVLLVTETVERVTTYRLTGAPEADRLITLDHPRNAGWTVSATTGPVERPDAWRWEIAVPAGQIVSFDVRETRPQQSRLGLVDMDSDALAYWLTRSSDAALSDTLRRLIDLRAGIAQAETQVRQASTRIQALSTEQARLVNLIVQLGDDSAANRDRRARVDQIDAEIAAAQAESTAAQATAQRLRDEAAALIRGQ